MKTVLITGASRGLGLEFCKQYHKLGFRVIALCRTKSKELASLDITTYEHVDVTDISALEKVKILLKDTAINILINNAGVLIDDIFPDFDYRQMTTQWEVNAIGPLKVTMTLLPLLVAQAKIIMITSRMGSINENTSGGYFGYRMSKAALNMAAVSLSQSLRKNEIMVGILHPGFVRTAMTGDQGNLSPHESVKAMIARIDQLTLEQSGQFYHCNGQKLAW